MPDTADTRNTVEGADTDRLPSRRVLLQGAALAALAVGSGCSRVANRIYPAAPAVTDALNLPPNPASIVRFLNRACWGPAPGEVARVAEEGLMAYLDAQLSAEPDSDEGRALSVRLADIDVLTTDPYELRDLPEDEVMLQLQQARLLRAAYSPWQLRERMVDFWSDHFNLYARKNVGEYLACNLIARDEQTVIRAHALGTFPDMLKASAKSPAMLGYLDNQKNRAGVANENYARELMELHTLGVDGGYSQKDVQEVARCLTGWTIEDGFLKDRSAFVFDESQHDRGEKLVLGQRIPTGGGQEDGEQVLNLLALHPATARHLARKLARYFHGTPTQTTVDETAALYLKTGGDIRAMVRHLLTGDAFEASPPTLKRPLDFVVSSLRATASETDGKSGVLTHLAKMGQSPYQWPMPDGYPDTTIAWTGSLLARWNFALALASGTLDGTIAQIGDKPTLPALITRILCYAPDDVALAGLKETLAPHTPPQAMALLLCSPAFQWR